MPCNLLELDGKLICYQSCTALDKCGYGVDIVYFRESKQHLPRGRPQLHLLSSCREDAMEVQLTYLIRSLAGAQRTGFEALEVLSVPSPLGFDRSAVQSQHASGTLGSLQVFGSAAGYEDILVDRSIASMLAFSYYFRSLWSLTSCTSMLETSE